MEKSLKGVVVLSFKCPLCDVKMDFKEDHGFYRCGDCESEFWPSTGGVNINDLWREEQKFKKTISKPGGNSTGRKKNPKKKYTPTAAERYRIY